MYWLAEGLLVWCVCGCSCFGLFVDVVVCVECWFGLCCGVGLMVVLLLDVWFAVCRVVLLHFVVVVRVVCF